MKSRTFEVFTALLLVGIAILYRVFPHPVNVAPVAAVAIFAGAVLPARLAFTVPLLAMMASDIFIGPHGLFWLTWSAFALTVFLGLWVRGSLRPARIAVASVAGSTFYFVVTNLGVFFFQNMYARTWAGLAECFAMALPFYRNSLIGDLIFSAALFGAYVLAAFTGRSRTSSAFPRR